MEFLSLLSSSNSQWFAVWAIVSAVSSVYAYIWDLVMVLEESRLPRPRAEPPG